jgi:hypothetical protein
MKHSVGDASLQIIRKYPVLAEEQIKRIRIVRVREKPPLKGTRWAWVIELKSGERVKNRGWTQAIEAANFLHFFLKTGWRV